MPQTLSADMPPGYCLREAATDQDFESFARLAKSYHDWLDADLNSFQNLYEELEALPGSYAAPTGCILLVSVQPAVSADSNNCTGTNEEALTQDIACVAIRPTIKHEGEEPARSINGPSEATAVIQQTEQGQHRRDCSGPTCALYSKDTCALKRLWVEEEHQKSGLGKVLLLAAMAVAKERGYGKMVLDTLESLESANKLYEQMGFEKRTPFYHNPLPGAVFWEKDLAA